MISTNQNVYYYFHPRICKCHFLQVEYEEERIPWQQIQFQDNLEVLELIEGKMGIINMLNEECLRPKVNSLPFYYYLFKKKRDPKITIYKNKYLHACSTFDVFFFSFCVEISGFPTNSINRALMKAL